MSALNCFLTADAAYVLTDTATYNANTGVKTGIAQKIEINAHLPAVFACRGSLAFAPVFAAECNARFGSFDQMSDHLVDVAKQCADTLKDGIAACGSTNLEILVAGWSGLLYHRPEAFTIRNYGDAAWKLTPIEVWIVSP